MADHTPTAPSRAERHTDSHLRPPHIYKAIGLIFLLALLFPALDQIIRIFLLVYAAVIVAIVLNPLATRLPIGRGWVAGLVALTLLSLAGVSVWLVVPILADQVRNFAESLPAYQETLEGWGEEMEQRTGIALTTLGEQLGEQAQAIGGAMFARLGGVLEFFLYPFLIVLGGLFMLANPNERLMTPALRLVPKDRRGDFERIGHLLAVRILGWLKGTLIAMFGVGLLSTIAFWIIGVPNAFLLGTLAGVFEFVPILGPWVGGLPAVVVALFDDPIKAVWVIIAVLLIQQLESQVITPWAMSAAADIHPMVTLFGLILFGSLFGLLGILLAIPLVILIWTVVQVLWVERTLETDKEAVWDVVEE